MAQHGELFITKEIVNDIWSVTIDLRREKLPEADKELVRKFGEPLINVGGDIDVPEYMVIELPEKFIKIFSGLPYKQSFDSKSEPFDINTAATVDTWLEVFLDRYRDAITTLRASEDTFTGESIESF